VPSPEKSASGSAAGLAQRIPASFFSIVIGLGGLGYARRAAGPIRGTMSDQYVRDARVV